MLNGINLVPTTKKIVALTKQNKAKNLNEIFFTAIQENDIEILAEIIKNFAEDSEGKNPFNGDINKVYEFIDELKKDSDYERIFKQVGEVINEMGFFLKKMTKEELEQAITTPTMSFNMNEVITNSTREAMTELVKEEFKGYKA